MDVYALTAPPSYEGGSERVKIAEIKLLTELYTSKHGDERLYFQHKRARTDLRYFPDEWRQLAKDTEECFDNKDEANIFGTEVPEGVWPDNDADAKDFFIDQQKTYGCPFAWLLP